MTIMPADPKASYLAHREELDRALREVMEGGLYILGPRVKAFETHFAAYLGAGHCMGVGSGTDALHLSLRAMGVERGDLVLTVSHTAVATVSAIDWVGAVPVLVDIDPITCTIDPQRVEDTLRGLAPRRVKVIIAVHLYGHPADTTALAAITERYGALLLEDCAQAHGASVQGRKVGNIGACAAFSFYPTKNLGAFGDGGAIVTSDAALAERVRLLQQYGWRERYISDAAGYNSRLDEIQAALLACKLKWLDDWNERRREIARRYHAALKDLDLQLPAERAGYRHVYHQYVVRTPARDALRQHLDARGVRTAVLYPMAVHQQPGYRDRVIIGAGRLTHTEQAVREILSLPMYPELDDRAVERVGQEIRSFYQVAA